MSRTWRTVLLIAALVLLALAVAALVFALSPGESLRDSIAVTPTLLVPPGVAP